MRIRLSLFNMRNKFCNTKYKDAALRKYFLI